MLLDIGMGIITAIVTTKIFPLTLTPALILVSVILALLPDVDVLLHIIYGGGIYDAHRHRDWLHRPLVYIVLGFFITFFITSTPYTLIFVITSLLHFLHDSIGIGWGVQWLYPFIKNHYALFYLYQKPGQEKIPRKFLYNWRDEEINYIAAKYGDKDWFTNIYLRWHTYAIVEFVFFLISIVILISSIS